MKSGQTMKADVCRDVFSSFPRALPLLCLKKKTFMTLYIHLCSKKENVYDIRKESIHFGVLDQSVNQSISQSINQSIKGVETGPTGRCNSKLQLSYQSKK